MVESYGFFFNYATMGRVPDFTTVPVSGLNISLEVRDDIMPLIGPFVVVVQLLQG